MRPEATASTPAVARLLPNDSNRSPFDQPGLLAN